MYRGSVKAKNKQELHMKFSVYSAIMNTEYRYVILLLICILAESKSTENDQKEEKEESKTEEKVSDKEPAKDKATATDKVAEELEKMTVKEKDNTEEKEKDNSGSPEQAER